MVPYQIHEVPFQHLTKIMHQLFHDLSLDHSSGVIWNTYLNCRIQEDTTVIVPDMHLDLRPRRPPGVPAIPFWVGECGFSSLQPEMEHQVNTVASIVPELDVGITFAIREQKYFAPPETHPLRTLPRLFRHAFEPLNPPNVGSLKAVIVKDVTWIEIKSVTVRVFLRRPDGTFNFKEKGSFYAQGVS